MAKTNTAKVIIHSLFDPEGLDKLKKGLDGVKPALAKIGIGVAGAGVAIAGGLAVAGKEALDFGDQATKAMESFANKTGIGRDELDDFKASALDIFAGNLGADIGDVADVMADVRNATGQAGEELKTTTRNALLLRDRFGQDVAKSINSVDSLMNQFGLTSQESFDFITFGLQNGLDKSGDFLDTISEYSNIFAQGGADAGQFFSVLETGAAGGVLGTDRIADAFKEFSLKAGGATDDTIEDFQNLITALGEMEDPLAANEIAVEKIGTQFEDLGLDIATAVDTSKTSIDEMAGSTAQAGQAGNDLGAAWESAMRQFQVAAEPAAQEILPLLIDGIRGIGEFLKEAQPVFSSFANDLRENMGPAMALITDALKRIGIAFGGATEETTGLDIALGILDAGLGVIVSGLQAVAIAAQGLAWVIEQVRKATDVVKGLIEQMSFINDLTEGNNFFENARAVGGGLGIPGFQEGGIVPGPIGSPQLAVVHGGETITPPGQGGGVNVNINGFGGAELAQIIERKVNEGLQEYTDTVMVPLMS